MSLRPRFEDITETTGIPLTEEAAAMMYSRYAAARRLARDMRVLEVGCGSGQGFGLVGSVATQLVGGDCSVALLRQGQAHYRGRFPFVQLSADALPFRDASFDLVLLFEASYYVSDADAALRECARVCASPGTVMLVNANPQRPDFIRSPHSVRYHTADDFREELGRLGFRVTVEGAFPVEQRASRFMDRIAARILRFMRRLLEMLHLVPRTLRGRARLKRLLPGKVRKVPEELPELFAPETPREVLSPGEARGYKVLYVTASLSP